jgi:protein-disulfide isomerase
MRIGRVIAIGASYVAAYALGALMAAGLAVVLGERAPARAEAPALAAAAIVAPAAAPQATELPAVTTAETLDGAREGMRLGSPSAPVQIVVFSDPQCPFCKKSAVETEPQIVAQFVSTGQAALVYRHFTFLGAESQRIAVAMECAAEQGRFWEFHRLAFEHQFPENASLATDEAMLAWAKEAGLDAGQFASCARQPEMAERVLADTNAGRRLGVTGTPTLFINGRPMPGALPFDFLKTAIEAQLDLARAGE